MEGVKYIHLLYVPTMACNMECKYCYLEDQTVDEGGEFRPVETLDYAISKFRESNVVPFNVSLHGGEVTTLSVDDFAELMKYICDYYEINREIITRGGFKVGSPHIKTNLLAIDRHLDAISQYNVSISGSLDLPLRQHDLYRVTKGNKTTLPDILKNIELLRGLQNKKKISATIFKEHFEHLDEIVEDIHFLHENTCLNMNDFNFMIGFAYNSNGLLTPLSQNEQVALFQRMHEEFDGTDLDEGVNGAWFNEFGPDYCTNCDNCGEKFFLLERNGDIYSCVRGQKNSDYFYGNIYENSVEEILSKARHQIFMNHNKLPFNEQCGECGYLYLCKTGCPFVKNTYEDNKSYTCMLQQELYQKRNYPKSENVAQATFDYVRIMHPNLMEHYIPQQEININVETRLAELISEDPRLKYIYDDSVFCLLVDEEAYFLQSQILRPFRQIIMITPMSRVRLMIKKEMLQYECQYPNNNSLYIMGLSGNTIVYGDEQRMKQAHVFTHQIFTGVLERMTEECIQNNDMPKVCGWKDDFYVVELGDLIKEYKNDYSKENPNNIFFTTSALRDYHYLKQKNNAFYHIQAINLPFQNIEFMLLGEEDFYA